MGAQAPPVAFRAGFVLAAEQIVERRRAGAHRETEGRSLGEVGGNQPGNPRGCATKAPDQHAAYCVTGNLPGVMRQRYRVRRMDSHGGLRQLAKKGDNKFVAAQADGRRNTLKSLSL